MSKKFTEEQYLEIVEAWDNNIVPTRATQSVIEELPNQSFALANPQTREWAHEQFVEKEKKYYWTSKKNDLSGNRLRLFRHENGGVSSYSRIEPANNINEDEQLTESEIKAWGYNPEMFDKEEVD